ncbi:Os03g0293850, partial [Oryza sativa Japonica Group]
GHGRSLSFAPPSDLVIKLGQLRPSNAGKDGKEWLLLEELQGQIARIQGSLEECEPWQSA